MINKSPRELLWGKEGEDINIKVVNSRSREALFQVNTWKRFCTRRIKKNESYRRRYEIFFLKG